MKRFVMIAISLFFLIVTIYYLYYVKGYYINFDRELSITTPFFVRDEAIYMEQSNKEPFTIKGVEVSSSYGPKKGTDFTISEETWMRWFEMIEQMGANTIRVSTVLDDQFYNAFYQYNINNETPLYLLQGMQVTVDDMILDVKDHKNPKFFESLKKDGRNLVDIIHGRKIILTNKYKGSGFYFRDVSPWVIGFLIGDEWNQDTIGYIDQTLDYKPVFNGKYVGTIEEATNFEALMAKVIDHIAGYESRKYHTQRPMSVNSLFIMDPFHYEEHYAAQLGKFTTFTMDHIRPTPNLKSGLFASYAFEEIEFPYLDMINRAERSAFPNATSYLDLLLQSHQTPVIISSVGYPGTGYLNDTTKQEDILVNDLTTFDTLGYNGAVIHTWQDVWDRRTPETSYAVDLQQVNDWHDALTSTQHFGLLGFKPYREKTLMEVDGKDDDWKDVEAAMQNKTGKIKMTRDHAYLYFWLEDQMINEQAAFYIALDTNPGLGSKEPNMINTLFDRDIDFLIEMYPGRGASVYVQERYQSIRGNFLEIVSGKNPFESYPEKHANKFERVKYLKDEKRMQTEEELLDFKTKYFRYTFENVNHLTVRDETQINDVDVAVGDGSVEIRIPYQLLNVYDPMKFTIHDDYYEHYGVEPLQVEQIYLSVANRHGKSTKSTAIPIESIGELEDVEEYLKPAYFTVKNYWKGED